MRKRLRKKKNSSSTVNFLYSGLPGALSHSFVLDDLNVITKGINEQCAIPPSLLNTDPFIKT